MEELTTGYISGGETPLNWKKSFASILVGSERQDDDFAGGEGIMSRLTNIYFGKYDSIATQVRETLSQLVDAASARCTEQSQDEETEAMNSRIVVLIWIWRGQVILFTKGHMVCDHKEHHCFTPCSLRAAIRSQAATWITEVLIRPEIGTGDSWRAYIRSTAEAPNSFIRGQAVCRHLAADTSVMHPNVSGKGIFVPVRSR